MSRRNRAEAEANLRWDQATARQNVRIERRLELAMEGQRFFDLRRWGIADVMLNSYLNGMAGGAEKTRRTQLASAGSSGSSSSPSACCKW